MLKTKKLLGIVLTLALVLNISFGLTCTKVDAASYVAYVNVVSYEGNDGVGLGHSFLAVQNTSSSTITIGKMQLAPGKTVTLGTFGNLEDGKCLYYNVEKYCMNDSNSNNNFTPNKFLGEYITSSELSTLNSTINSNTSWTLSDNCASFAADCWNSFSDRQVSSNSIFLYNQYYYDPIANPHFLAGNIEKQSGNSTNLFIPGPCGTGDVYYQSSSTSLLKQSSLKTMDKLKSSSSSLGS